MLLARRHFLNKAKERKRNEIKLIKKLLRNKLTPDYLPIIINSPLALELLEPNSNIKIRGVDIRKIKVIRDFVEQLNQRKIKGASSGEIQEVGRYENLLNCLEDGISLAANKAEKSDVTENSEQTNEEEGKQKREIKLPKHYDPQRFY